MVSCGQCGICYSYSVLPSQSDAADNMKRDGYGDVPVKLYENRQLAIACQFLS